MDEVKLFKDGYEFKVERYNFQSKEIQEEIKCAHIEQQEILDRKKIDIEVIKNRFCTI